PWCPASPRVVRPRPCTTLRCAYGSSSPPRYLLTSAAADRNSLVVCLGSRTRERRSAGPLPPASAAGGSRERCPVRLHPHVVDLRCGDEPCPRRPVDRRRTAP